MTQQDSIISLTHVSKAFGDVRAVQDISIDVKKGELVTFIGPSGCGKTTLLRTIAGFYSPTAGEIYLEGTRINDFPPEKRATGMVFQNYALFPHMTIFENVAYGLDVRKETKETKKERVNDALAQVQLEGYENRKPSELSGGQQQRVAIARCLVLKPKVLLLDEPLSNLDANLRMMMRDEIRRLKEELDLTIIFVTHDQEEALSISDRLMVLNEGNLQQLDKPEVIYQRPVNEFVANFVGHANLLSGQVKQDNNNSYFVSRDIQFTVENMNNGNGLVLIRPEMIHIHQEGEVEGVVINKVYHGNSVRYEVRVGDTVLLADDYNVFGKNLYSKGQTIYLDIPKQLHLISA
ncbi:ABC transporter ATP-binding protein [Natribacillus halophilus]|uniref:Carnitine transport ATP-binding protein OpuCA n=1 Tax=Natribacillus halophilus TaxID=549003 RepID=A0A1G8QQM8_9BACI|nr:ABC transporter ATP-binding protein [Natribacillus halophilus]SDJ07007.1 iron(III) transport system ATP-binding protein [Natribacillus halophilus]